jgi:micrococcal nuclease
LLFWLSTLSRVWAFTDGARELAPAGRGLGFRVDAPAAKTAADVLTIRPVSERPLAFVTRAVDGDTLRLREGGVVRLIGVDTPETKHPARPVQWCGPEASAFTRAAIEKRWAELGPDQERRDRYGRWLAYVHREPDRFFLNAEIVRQGAGRAFTRFPFRHGDWFIALEREARADRLGIWGDRPGEGACVLPAPVAALVPPREMNETARPATPAVPLRSEESGRAGESARPEQAAPEAAPAQPRMAPAAASPAPERPRAAQETEQPRKEASAPPAAAPATPSPECRIKGNISRSGARIYHVPGGQSYPRTQIDESRGERWFCSEEEARAAGWRKAAR